MTTRLNLSLMRRFISALCASCMVLCCPVQASNLTVSAASSLSTVFKELIEVYQRQHSETHVDLNFAASDALVQQIANGAPVDVLAVADQTAMDKAQPWIVAGSRRDFVANALVVVTPRGSQLALHALKDLQLPTVQHIALGHPETTPFGRYAKQALDQRGMWQTLLPKAVYAQNVRQALDYVARGEVDAGFVYATDVATQKDKVQLAFTVASDQPPRYPLAIVRASSHQIEAQNFVDFLMSDAAQKIFSRHGFLAL